MFTIVVDGRVNPKPTIRWRPMELKHANTPCHILGVYSGHIKDHKGIHITPSWDVPTGDPLNPYQTVTFSDIIVQDARLEDFTRSPGMHMDCIFIDGARDRPIDVLIKDIVIEQTQRGVEPIFLTGGQFGTITLERVFIYRNETRPMLDMRSGHTNKLVIRQCPGLIFDAQGQPGSIDEVILENSPGAVVNDCLNADMTRIGLKIQVVNTQPVCATCGSLL